MDINETPTGVILWPTETKKHTSVKTSTTAGLEERESEREREKRGGGEGVRGSEWREREKRREDDSRLEERGRERWQ